MNFLKQCSLEIASPQEFICFASLDTVHPWIGLAPPYPEATQ